MTESVGVRALQQNAAAVLRQVASGDVVEITDRGRVVAQLSPAHSGGLATLVATGAARPARLELAELPPPIAAAGPSLGALLDRAREGER